MAAQVEHLKWIQGTNFMVDGFNFQSPRCRSYFLTHFHSDHTTGLRKNFCGGVIYCSEITAVLLRKDMGMPPERIIPLPMDEPLEIDGVTVTLIDANHCPGSCMFLFQLPYKAASPSSPRVILHVGDMRWHPRLGRHPALRAVKVDLLYLDTTYASPKHVFPCQEDAIAEIVRLMRKERPGTLFVVGSYHIGKERAFLGAAKALGWKVWCNANKKKTMKMLRLPEADMALLTTVQTSAQIHVTFMGQGLQPEALEQRISGSKWSHVVAFRPTGWSFRKSGGLDVRKEGNVTIYGIPYSEHSSFLELRDCVRTLRPSRIIPTVNVTNDPATARAIVDRFADLMDLSRDKSRLDVYFKPKARKAQQRLLAYIAASRGLSCKRAADMSPPAQLAKKQLSIAGFLKRKVCA
ncbi:hypothetical protein WJX72_007365 [[Myrmecia] bisecta]|uniref:DNA repair metallo-beta-lactamase domain-containing protein n=1 Tax=[Myrmecia] bisecta TaxID=41462 RepID=A0AAW1P8S8_9CHLO